MTIPATAGAFAIVPSNNLAAAQPFWERPGFKRTGGDANYIILTGWGCEVHVTQAGSGPWRVPEEHNPVDVFIRTPEVDAIAAGVDDLIVSGVFTRLGFADRMACWSPLVGPPTSCRKFRLLAALDFHCAVARTLAKGNIERT